IFSEYGPPKILHTDNGEEFIADIINQLLKECPTMKIIHGHSHHSQSQGSIERGNQELKKKFGHE
ncbi:4671_t:CDS:1, partial [Ambispora gerdemannii]